MKNVLYFHGFASSPASAKITALKPLLEPYAIELDTPDLNVPSFEQLDFDAIVEHAWNRAQDHPPHAVVGSSLGSLVALAISHRGVRAPLVLIAPALGVARRWESRIPATDPVTIFNYARNADATIHRRFFEQMSSLHVDDDPPPSRITAIMGRKDETVPFDVVLETWQRWESSGRLAKGSRFIELEEGDHGLVSYADVITGAIVEAVGAQ
jgi:predicted esterase YcpF (UPF0227 family)